YVASNYIIVLYNIHIYKKAIIIIISTFPIFKKQIYKIFFRSASFYAFMIDLFRISHSLNQYKTIIAIANNAGIASILLYSYNTLMGQICCLHLIWEVDTLDMVIKAQPLLNDLLKDNSLTNSYPTIMENPLENTVPDYNKIISTEVADDYIERIPSTPERTGEILILSTSFIELITDRNTNIVIKLPSQTD
ncbi:hypothetical protein DPV78_000145, partial [Talaromyces pinophilus]